MIFNVETLTAATWLCGLEPNVSLDLREAIQSYFPVFFLVQDCQMEALVHLNRRSNDGEATECRLCKHCRCMLNTDYLWLYKLIDSWWDQKQEIKFVWPKLTAQGCAKYQPSTVPLHMTFCDAMNTWPRPQATPRFYLAAVEKRAYHPDKADVHKPEGCLSPQLRDKIWE